MSLVVYLGISIDGLPKEAPTNGASLPQSPDIDEHDDY